MNVNIFESTYDFKVDNSDEKNNEKDNDILIIIEEKIDDEKKDYSSIFKNDSRIDINAL